MKPLVVPPLALLACAYLSGCADVQESSHIVGGRTGTQLTASVGDTVLRVSREKNLPNIVGKSDILGRKTPTGVDTVQYLGAKDGRAFFKRRSVNVENGATTMNSTPIRNSKHGHDNPERVSQRLRPKRVWPWLVFGYIHDHVAADSDSGPSVSTNGNG